MLRCRRQVRMSRVRGLRPKRGEREPQEASWICVGWGGRAVSGSAGVRGDTQAEFSDVVGIRTQEWKYTSVDFYMASLITFKGRGYPQLYDMCDKTESYSVASLHPDIAKVMDKRLRQLQSDFAPLRTTPPTECQMPQKHVPEMWGGFGAD